MFINFLEISKHALLFSNVVVCVFVFCEHHESAFFFETVHLTECSTDIKKMWMISKPEKRGNVYIFFDPIRSIAFCAAFEICRMQMHKTSKTILKITKQLEMFKIVKSIFFIHIFYFFFSTWKYIHVLSFARMSLISVQQKFAKRSSSALLQCFDFLQISAKYLHSSVWLLFMFDTFC